eukprot:Skav226936  [mRNA]  locus=scaffold965:187989:194033:- [translate_table: standard]
MDPPVMVPRMAFVSPSCEKINPEDDEVLAEINEGALVEVEEVKLLAQRFRARLAQPAGWITLQNTETGRRHGGSCPWEALGEAGAPWYHMGTTSLKQNGESSPF